MQNTTRLSDHDHPLVRSTAAQLTATSSDAMEKLAAIFHFVRDEIRFGFPPKWDAVKASETITYQLGYCNTKATLFHALCQAANIPSRLHTGLIDIQIMRGILPGFAFPFLPDSGGHTWMEVQVEGSWQPIDSYINDQPFYEQAARLLRTSGKPTAFSVCEAQGVSSCAFNFGEQGFVHMGAVVADHGVWDDFSAYMASHQYVAMSKIQQASFPIIASISNRNVARIRRGQPRIKTQIKD